MLLSDWALKPSGSVVGTTRSADGDSLSYSDMMERNAQEEARRARERQMMEEGKSLWIAKKKEELELELRDQEKVGT